MFGAIFIPIFYTHHILILFKKTREKRNLIYFGYIFGILSAVADLTPFFVNKVSKKMIFSFWPEPGVLYHPFLFIWFIYVLYGVYIIFNTYLKTPDFQKNQIKFLLTATIIGWAGGATNYPLWYNIPLPPVGNILVSVYILLTTYAISKHLLYDIDLAFHYLFTWTFSLGTATLLILPCVILSRFIFPTVVLQIIFSSILSGLSVALFPFYYPKYEAWSNKYILKGKYDYLKIIPQRVNKWLRDINLRKLKPMVESDLKEVMGFEGAGIYLAGDWVIGTHEACKFFYSINPEKIDDDGVAKIARDSWLVKFMKTQQRVLFLSELKKEMTSPELPEPVREERREVLRELEALKAETVLPVIFEDAYLRYVVGVVVLSRWPLKNLDEVASDDRTFFEKLAEDISAAVGQAVEKEKTEISDKRKTEMTMQLIKETQKLEQEKSQAEEALAKSEEKTDEIADMASVFATKIQLLNETLEDLEVITSNSQAGLLTIRDGRIKSANHKAEIFLLSKGLAKIVGEPYEKVFADKFENLNLLLEDIKKVLAKGTIARNFETKWLNDNESIPVELKITPLRDVRNFAKITGALVEIVDISEVKERQRLLNIKDKFETFREVVQGFNHEVRNPLNILNTLVYSLKNLKEKIMADPEFFNDFCSVVPQAIKNIEDLLKNLTDVEIPKKLEGAESLNIQKSAEGVLAEFAERTEKAKIEMVEEFSPLPLLIANPKHFKIIFYEVFKNSIEAIEEYDRLREMGQGERLGGKIFIKGRINEAGEVEIKIVDTGIGIDESELDKVVNPFHTSKTHSVTKPESGTGLGLSRVYSILQNYGGALKIESKLREGTTITMTFKKEMTV